MAVGRSSDYCSSSTWPPNPRPRVAYPPPTPTPPPAILLLVLCTTLASGVLSASFALSPVRERASGSRALQLSAGARPSALLAADLLVDCALYSVRGGGGRRAGWGCLEGVPASAAAPPAAAAGRLAGLDALPAAPARGSRRPRTPSRLAPLPPPPSPPALQVTAGGMVACFALFRMPQFRGASLGAVAALLAASGPASLGLTRLLQAGFEVRKAGNRGGEGKERGRGERARGRSIGDGGVPAALRGAPHAPARAQPSHALRHPRMHARRTTCAPCSA